MARVQIVRQVPSASLRPKAYLTRQVNPITAALDTRLLRHQLYRIPTRSVGLHYRSASTIPGLPDQPEDDDAEAGGSTRKSSQDRSRWQSTLFKMFESAATTFASLAVLGAGGYGYHLYYKSLVLRKMDVAFSPGDPVLDLASPTMSSKPTIGSDERSAPRSSGPGDVHWEQPAQAQVDRIMAGELKGRYYLLVGEKGTGKSGMIIEGMRKVDGAGISMFEAHADLEIFRVRLGRALNYEYHEDYIGSLFSVRGPRETTPLLDIERAFNKLEKIALARRARKQNPLVMVVNCTHLIRDDEDGKDLLELIQQRAEAWAANNLVTFVFNSDEYWVYERLKRYATRMEVIPVRDLTKAQSLAALHSYRTRYFPSQQAHDGQILTQVYDMVGGRINYLARVAKASDMIEMARAITQDEKTWFLNRCGLLGSDMDDDVLDQQKFASAAMVLARALVKESEAMDRTYDAERGHVLPSFPLSKARQIMTRADFIEKYDRDNLFHIDADSNVRADSVPMMNAFREICAEEGFDQYLQDTLDRISAIESLGRTRELSLKDLWVEQSGDQRGAYEAVLKDRWGSETGKFEFRVKPDGQPEDEKEDSP